MNSKVKELVTAFNTYARQMLQEQELELKTVKDRHLLSGKLAQMKVFNEHLEILKDKLQTHTHTILQSASSIPPDQYKKLEIALTAIYAECINDFMSIGFIKENE